MNARAKLTIGLFVGSLIGLVALHDGPAVLGQLQVPNEAPLTDGAIVDVRPGAPPAGIPTATWRYYAFDSRARGLVLLDTATGSMWQLAGNRWASLPALPNQQGEQP